MGKRVCKVWWFSLGILASYTGDDNIKKKPTIFHTARSRNLIYSDQFLGKVLITSNSMFVQWLQHWTAFGFSCNSSRTRLFMSSEARTSRTASCWQDLSSFWYNTVWRTDQGTGSDLLPFNSTYLSIKHSSNTDRVRLRPRLFGKHYREEAGINTLIAIWSDCRKRIEATLAFVAWEVLRSKDCE